MAEFKWSDGTSTKMSNETERALQKKFGPKPKPKFGDIVTCALGRRVVLRESGGNLWAYDRSGYEVRGASDDFYTLTGENIFTSSNLLGLDG